MVAPLAATSHAVLSHCVFSRPFRHQTKRPAERGDWRNGRRARPFRLWRNKRSRLWQRPPTPCFALRVFSPPLPAKTKRPAEWLVFLFWQGQKDSNPRHPVLETSVLPTELYPYTTEVLYHNRAKFATPFCKKNKKSTVFYRGRRKITSWEVRAIACREGNKKGISVRRSLFV